MQALRLLGFGHGLELLVQILGSGGALLSNFAKDLEKTRLENEKTARILHADKAWERPSGLKWGSLGKTGQG